MADLAEFDLESDNLEDTAESFPSYEELDGQIESDMDDLSDTHEYEKFSVELDEDIDFADMGEPFEKMSMDELLATPSDMEGVTETDMEESGLAEGLEEDSFSDQIEQMSLDELMEEGEPMVEMDAIDDNAFEQLNPDTMTDEQLADTVETLEDESRKQRDFDDLVEGMSLRDLEEMKTRLSVNDQEMIAIFKGTAETSEEGGYQKTK